MATNEDDAAGYFSSATGREAEHAAEGLNFQDETDEEESKYISRRSIRRVDEMASWAGQPSVKGSTDTMRMALLTFSAVGLQCVLSAN